MSSSTATSTQPAPDETPVRPADLERLDVIHSILRALNDSLVSATTIADYAERLRPLRARITRCYVARFPTRAIPPLAQQVAILGNREVESVLLALLEDLTVLRADLLSVE